MVYNIIVTEPLSLYNRKWLPFVLVFAIIAVGV